MVHDQVIDAPRAQTPEILEIDVGPSVIARSASRRAMARPRELRSMKDVLGVSIV